MVMLPPKLGELVKLLWIVVEVGVIVAEVVISSSFNLTIVSAFSIGIVWPTEDVWVSFFSPPFSKCLPRCLLIWNTA